MQATGQQMAATPPLTALNDDEKMFQAIAGPWLIGVGLDL